MMKIFQINTSLNTGSTGRIAEEIGVQIVNRKWQSYIAHGRPVSSTISQNYKIGNKLDQYLHAIQTRFFDSHAFASKYATRCLINFIKKSSPDIIHLHNLHGYYLHVGVLFNWLATTTIPIVWTLHDCWPFTGHCTFFDSVGCEKWKTACYACPKKRMYPTSLVIDRSKKNFQQKKQLFTMPKLLHIVTPSNWLAGNVRQSFLRDWACTTIHNGIDLSIFSPEAKSAKSTNSELDGIKIILGVASIWDKRKGLDDFIQLSKYLSPGQKIVLVGLNKQQLKLLPSNIVGIMRTENVTELAALYSAADVFVNPTWQDNFPTTNLEALACGTPVITYNTGGSPEAIDEHTGIVVDQGNIKGLAEAVSSVLEKGKSQYQIVCRHRALKYFNKDDRYSDYLKLYEKLLAKPAVKQ
jgi:putative colanic acid biosynthesis glycosyltransferase